MLTTKQIKYLKPADDWNECIPVGNGFIGAMINGSPELDTIYLNEDSFWYGGYRDRHNKFANQYLDKIRQLIFDEDFDEATDLGLMALCAVPESQRNYLPAGNLRLRTHHNNVQNYSRELNLETAISSTKYTCEGITHKRDYFVNNPSNVFVIHFSADKSNSVNFMFDFGRERNVDEIEYNGTDTFYRRAYSGGENGVTLSSVIKVVADGGETQSIGQNIRVKNANTATIYLSLATTYRQENAKAYCEEIIGKASSMNYCDLLNEHISDYKKMFNTLSLDLSSSTIYDNTDDIFANLTEQNANHLIETYFNFGRYLLISCSREGSLPANLQGIWNNDFFPAWDSKYTININTEMNYWPAELLNLSPCHLPLFDLLKTVSTNGAVTAKKMYNARGYCCHHNTDIWGDTAPQDKTTSATIWALGGAWLSTHIVDRFDFTNDLEFAKNNFDLLKGACEFILDYQFLYKNQYVTSPSVSPENTFVLESGKTAQLTYSCAMDTQLIITLFEGTIRVAKAIGIENEFINTLEERISKMPKPVVISDSGRIMEWIKDYEELEKGHRHISHLFALYPSNIIGDDKAMLDASRKTLETRLSSGGGHTGWSMAWIINLWARLKDGEKLNEAFVKLLQNSTYPNLFDKHPPFQIDGNFGSIAGIGEALVQSHNGYIELLPSLPSTWKNGSINGICARGNFELDITWENGELKSALIKNKNPQTKKITVKYKDIVKTMIIGKESSF